MRGLKLLLVCSCNLSIRRTSCRCVDWNYYSFAVATCQYRRTSCRCVDWNVFLRYLVQVYIRRTSCRCVDWNSAFLANILLIAVAPHVGAWIETTTFDFGSVQPLVAPHVGAWIETGQVYQMATSNKCRTSCRCVDWNSYCSGAITLHLKSHLM